MSDPNAPSRVLPESGEGTETPPLRARPDRLGWYGRLSRRWRMAMWLALVLWAAAGVLFVADWGPFQPADRDAAPEGIGPTGTLLVVAEGEDGALPAMFLLARSESGTAVVLMPATTVVEVPGEGSPRPLHEALQVAGSEGLVTAVGNVLGIRVPGLVTGSPPDVRGLVDDLDGVEVDVPETIEIEQDGRLRTLYTAGTTRMDGDTFLAYLTAAIPEQQEFERVARQGSAWRALFSRLAERGDPSSFAGWRSDGTLRPRAVLLDTAARDPDLRFLTLPVRRVAAPGADIYDVDRDELSAVHAALDGVRTVERREGRRIRLLVGAEGPVGPAVARELVGAGFVIVLTGPASEPYDTTRVVIAENTPELRRTAGELTELLGTGRLGVFRRSQTVFDVTLVIGRDWAEANGFPQPEA